MSIKLNTFYEFINFEIMSWSQNMIKILDFSFFFYKCGDNDTSVATFVATLVKMLDTAALVSISATFFVRKFV